MALSRHAAFDRRYIWWALAFALFAGFALGAHVVSVIGFDLPLGKTFSSYVQTHGFIQLVGWVGLFIIGVSLHVLPRMTAAPIASSFRTDIILHSVTAGLLLRFLSRAFLPYLKLSPLFGTVSLVFLLSAVCFCLGAWTFVATLISSFTRVPDLQKRPALKGVQPFFLLMLVGWAIFPFINLLLSLEMWYTKSIVLNPSWNEFGLQLFLHLILFPVTFAFSIRLLPIYMRLPVIDWHTIGFAFFYGLVAIAGLMLQLPPVARSESALIQPLNHIFLLLKSSAILWFIWRLGVLHKRRDLLREELDTGWTAASWLQDIKQFGIFHKVIKASFAWLAVGAAIESLQALCALINVAVPVSTDAVRHTYLLGFVTQLIMGM